ncbi:hypothetical protein P186_1090 [Pyrobaculum ferrireducens]|uniref:Uncharacterized protein n=1 Tax=Pyrobaculum ferrireducens TaxID=1104324 RepID=G7VC26_9CREN|nr:hypothetical protein P186_1090 [Pyrobaculum ferrireducens]
MRGNCAATYLYIWGCFLEVLAGSMDVLVLKQYPQFTDIIDI